MEPLSYEKRGYLNENFRLFHLADSQMSPLNYHYHAFHKLVVLLAGKASYCIEGERYDLEPGSFVLVGQGSIHRPEVEPGTFYERMILYISPEYLNSLSTEDCDLGRCFAQAQSSFHYVYRGDERLLSLLHELECALDDREFGSRLLSHSLFLQLMVALNRAAAGTHFLSAASGDSKIVSILQYLGMHLSEPISIDELAERFYISKYHMMRRFKEETGYTIHNYVTEKRLLAARQLLRTGSSLAEVCELSGYQDYSTFSRAYRKRFGEPPSAYRRQL